MSDRLQDKLQAWARRNEPSPADLERLANRIRVRASYERQGAWRHQRAGILVKLRYASAGALVALAVVAVIHLRSRGPQVARTPATVADHIAAITPQAMAVDRRLFAEVETLFTDRLRWVAQSNGDVALGVDPLPGGVSASCLPAVVKLVVVARAAGTAEWVPAWQTEVILRSEESVEVASGPNTANKLALWVYPLSDGRVAVDTDLVLAEPFKLSSQHNTVMTQGVPLEIMDIEYGDTEFRVLQTVTMLNRDC